jgi:Uma2 family endonuclease
MIMKTGVNKGRYPDVTIDCGQRNAANQSAPKPVVVFEVLSPKTQKEDRTVKLAEYNAVPTIAHYVLVEQSEPLVHVYSRARTGDFIIKPEEIEGVEGSLDLPAIGISISMAEIYENVDFGDNVPIEPPTPIPWVR